MNALVCRMFGHRLLRLYTGRSVDRLVCTRCWTAVNQRKEAA